jgi:multidrug resistance efflux pump
MATVNREPPDLRRFYRLSVPIRISIDETEHPVAEWSLGDFKVTDFFEEVSPGDNIDVKITIPFQGFEVSFSQKARVVRFVKETGEMAGEFRDMDKRRRELLKFFVQGLMSGELTFIEDMIRRIDIPVTPVQVEPQISSKDQSIGTRLKRLTIGGMYLALGLGVTLFILSILYSHLFRLQVKTAVVAAHLETIITPESGMLKRVYYTPGDLIRQGEPLFAIENSELVEAAKMAELKVEEAKLALEQKEARLRDERAKIDIYRRIAKSRQKAALHKVNSLKKEVSIMQRELARKQKLLSKGVLSESEVDLQKKLVTSFAERLKSARSELKIAKESTASIELGWFFTGEKLDGLAPSMETEVQAARELGKIRMDELAAVQERYEALTVKAPFDGRLVHFLKSVGNIVAKAQPLTLLERGDERFIEAFLTQSEVANVQPGEKARVFIPATNERYTATITGIDRTSGVTDKIESRYRWRKTQYRSVLVTLSFDSIEAGGKNNGIAPGLPVIVNFDKVPVNEVMLWVRSKLGTDNLQAATREE